jgi:hypothetical protein
MSALQRTSTAKVMPTFPRLEGDPPRPPSPSTKPTVPLYNRPQTPTTWAAKGGAGNGAAMTSFAERTAAPKAYLKTAGAINSSGFNSPTASSVVNSTPVATQVESVVGRTSISTRPPLEIDEIVKESVVHGVAGESLRQAKKLRSQPELGKKRSNYFDETVPEPPATAPLQEAFRQNDGIIVAELVTNVFVSFLPDACLVRSHCLHSLTPLPRSTTIGPSATTLRSLSAGATTVMPRTSWSRCSMASATFSRAASVRRTC